MPVELSQDTLLGFGDNTMSIYYIDSQWLYQQIASIWSQHTEIYVYFIRHLYCYTYYRNSESLFKALRTIMVYISLCKIANSKILRAQQLLEDNEDWQALDP